MSEKFGRPSQGRGKRLQAAISEEVLKWLERRAFLEDKSVSDIAFAILNGAMLKERSIPMLTWNSDSEMYEATVDGKLIRVSNDEFSESESEMVKANLEKGMSQERAKAKAWEECRWAGGWISNGYDG